MLWVLLQICLMPYERGGPYAGLLLFTEQARMARPVRQVKSRKTEMIGSLEQINMHIRSVSRFLDMFFHQKRRDSHLFSLLMSGAHLLPRLLAVKTLEDYHTVLDQCTPGAIDESAQKSYNTWLISSILNAWPLTLQHTTVMIEYFWQCFRHLHVSKSV